MTGKGILTQLSGEIELESDVIRAGSNKGNDIVGKSREAS